MKKLIGEALDSEAIIEGRREMSVGKIVDKIVAELPHTEAEISEDQVSQADRDVEEIRLSESVDSEGNRLSVQQERYFADSKVRDADGNLLVMYHGIGSEFYEFRIGDVGYHVGTKEQADIRVKDSGFDNIRMLQLYVNIKNPLWALRDYGDWHGKYVAARFLEDEMFEGEDYEEEINARLAAIADEMEDGPEADKALRELLKEYGFDGIKYENYFEGDSGDFSFIAFDSNQIKNTDNLNPTESDDIRHSLSEEQKETLNNLQCNFDGTIIYAPGVAKLDPYSYNCLKSNIKSGNPYIGPDCEHGYVYSRAKKYMYKYFFEYSGGESVYIYEKEQISDGIVVHREIKGVYTDESDATRRYSISEEVASQTETDGYQRRDSGIHRESVQVQGESRENVGVFGERGQNGYQGDIEESGENSSDSRAVQGRNGGVNIGDSLRSDSNRRAVRWSDSENLDMIGADVSEVYEELPELSDLINRQNAQTRGRVYSDASIRSAAAEILNAVSAEVAEARRGELELMLRDAFVNWSRRGISAEAFMEQARKIGQWVIDNGKQAKVESRRMTEERNKSRSAALVIYPEEKSMVGRVPVI